jgi:hypothetical protein
VTLSPPLYRKPFSAQLSDPQRVDPAVADRCRCVSGIFCAVTGAKTGHVAGVDEVAARAVFVSEAMRGAWVLTIEQKWAAH